MNAEVQELVEALREGRGTVDGRRFQIPEDDAELVLYYDGAKVLDPETREPVKLPAEPADPDWETRAREMLTSAFVLAGNGASESSSYDEPEDDMPPEPTDQSERTDEYVCETCGFRAVDKRGLNAHERSHTSVTCDICGKEISGMGIGNHMKWHRERGEVTAIAQTEQTQSTAGDGGRPEPTGDERASARDEILRLRETGMSFDAIAVWLNENGYRTSRDNPWSPSSTRNVVYRAQGGTTPRRPRHTTAGGSRRGTRAVAENGSGLLALELLADLLGEGMSRASAIKHASRVLDLELARR